MNTRNEFQDSRLQGEPRGRRQGWLRPWLLGLVFVGLLGLGLSATTMAASAQSTVPPAPKHFTVLTGPIDAISNTHWVVAGVTISVTDDTRINERIGPAAREIKWARVTGYGDGEGALLAVRIKVLPQLPFVMLRGPLDELTDSVVVVDGITLALTDTTRVVGNPIPGQDWVGVRAEVEIVEDPENEDNSTSALLALQVRKERHLTGKPEEPEEPEDGETELIGQIQDISPTTGIWTVSGIEVRMGDSTEIEDPVGGFEDGAPVVGAWIKVEGTGSGGVLEAREIKTTATRDYAKLEGTLDSFTSGTEVVVDTIVVAVDEDTAVQGEPVPGQRVKVLLGEVQEDGSPLAVSIEFKHHQEPGPDPGNDGHEVKFAGWVDQLPEDGSLYGDWVINRRTVVVDTNTQIREEKGDVAAGALVKVEAIWADGQLLALEIDVKRGGHGGGEPGGAYVRFIGAIDELPTAEPPWLGIWIVGGRKVEVSTRTELKNAEQIALQVRVQVKGYQRGNTIQAREIEVEHEGDGDPGHESKLEGTIKSFPRNLIGIWEIVEQESGAGLTVSVEDGRPGSVRFVKATAQTEFDQDDGEFEVDAPVEVRGVMLPSGMMLASKIKTGD